MILIPVFGFFKNLAADKSFSGLHALMFKGAGICLLSSIASEICKDCNESSLGAKIEFAAKCTLITMSLPLIEKVFKNATTFID